MRRENLAWSTVAVMLAGIASHGFAQTAKLINKFNDWTFYAYDGPQGKTCFAAGSPKTSEPAGARRDGIYFYIAAWPKDGVRSEVSVKIGYPFRKGSDPTVTIGTTTFKLFTKDDRAFVANATEELKLIEAMKKGSSMVVQGVSERGTATKDTYSLSGLAQALHAMNARCP
jgi:hypothetical protein